jgi:hypothetical protein
MLFVADRKVKCLASRGACRVLNSARFSETRFETEKSACGDSQFPLTKD